MLTESNLIKDRELYSDSNLNSATIFKAGNYALKKLNDIDMILKEDGGRGIAEMVELANLSSMLGNFMAVGIEKFNKNFKKNEPHTYPDLLGKGSVKDIEIKVSLEKYKPKGHLPKVGKYLILRYVLLDENFKLSEKRGSNIDIYEILLGDLTEADFNISSTENDSGKTASIKSSSLLNMGRVYHNRDIDPNLK